MNTIQFLRALVTDEIKFTDEDIKDFMILERTLNKEKFINDLCDKFETLSNHFYESVTKSKMEIINCTNYDGSERMISVSELKSIFNVQKGTIHNWIETGIIKRYSQKVKNGKITIPISEIENVIRKYPKYTNQWINYNNKK